jgi:hypothetical protein
MPENAWEDFCVDKEVTEYNLHSINFLYIGTNLQA